VPKPKIDAKRKSKPAEPASNRAASAAVPKQKVDAEPQSKLADRAPRRAGSGAGPTQDFVTAAATLGVLAAGVALLEVALIPGIVLGGAAVLAPKYVPKVLPKLRRSLQPLFDSISPAAVEPSAPGQARPGVKLPLAIPAKLAIKQALIKTITFRVIVTTLDFTSNYVVLGELGTSAGLSAFGFVVAPLLYLAHETGWNYFGPPAEEKIELGGFTISRALAKTVTFRIVATAIDFTTLYVVVGDLPTAVGLAAFGFVIGPFVYYGHEWAWDHYGSPAELSLDLSPPPKLLPAPS
jgi:uncharacterized membrane protein